MGKDNNGETERGNEKRGDITMDIRGKKEHKGEEREDKP